MTFDEARADFERAWKIFVKANRWEESLSLRRELESGKWSS